MTSLKGLKEETLKNAGGHQYKYTPKAQATQNKLSCV